jgi:hypothetical protein
MLRLGSIVEFKHPFADEIGMTYRLIEDNGDRVLIRAIIDLPFPPTQTVMRVDLKAARTLESR